MSRESQRSTDRPPRSGSNASGFRWVVVVIDCVLGLWLGYLSFSLFFHQRRDFSALVPDEIWGVLSAGLGMWVLYSGYRLVSEPPPICWLTGKRRHVISAGISGFAIPSMWLLLFGNLGDDFGPIIRVLNYSGVFGGVFLFSLVAAYAMSRLAPKDLSENRPGFPQRLAEELKPPSERNEH